jgi:hypothetical protein
MTRQSPLTGMYLSPLMPVPFPLVTLSFHFHPRGIYPIISDSTPCPICTLVSFDLYAGSCLERLGACGHRLCHIAQPFLMDWIISRDLMMGTGCMKLLLLLISSQVDEMVMSSRDKYDQHDFDPPNSQIPADYPVHEEGLSDVTEPMASRQLDYLLTTIAASYNQFPSSTNPFRMLRIRATHQKSSRCNLERGGRDSGV